LPDIMSLPRQRPQGGPAARLWRVLPAAHKPYNIAKIHLQTYYNLQQRIPWLQHR
jgi:hypothetical protein